MLGNVGQDPELRYTNSGTAVLNLRLATSERYKDRETDEWKESTDWHNVVIWSARAEALGKILRKGSEILVEGSIHTRSYEGRDGSKRYSTEVKAREIELCGSKPSGDGKREQAPAHGHGPVDGHPGGDNDDW